MIRRLPRGIVRAVSGIVEDVGAEPYRTIVSESAEVIGAGIASERVRRRLIVAVQLNVANHREWPFEGPTECGTTHEATSGMSS